MRLDGANQALIELSAKFRPTRRAAMSQPNLTGEPSMTTAKPFARYSAIWGALASGFATTELHHLLGRDLRIVVPRRKTGVASEN
jgi:hypothetical protein